MSNGGGERRVAGRLRVTTAAAAGAGDSQRKETVQRLETGASRLMNSPGGERPRNKAVIVSFTNRL